MNNEIITTTNVGAINQVDLKAKILELLRWAHNRMRIKIDSDSDMAAMLVFDAQEISSDLQTIQEFKTLKLPQIREAFQKGLSGGYGEFFGLNCVTYAKWIRAYLSEKKVSVGTLEHEIVKNRLAEAKEPSEAEKKELSEANLQRVIEKYKRSGIIDDNGNPAFLYLWNTGRIRFDENKRQELLDRAEQIEKSRLHAEKEAAKDEIDKIKVIEITRQLQALNPNIIKSIARNLAVQEWVENEINK
jgi:hypothetical protein